MRKRHVIAFVLVLALALSACSARQQGTLPEPEYTTPTTAPEATPTPTPEPTPTDEYFVISMVGDCTLSSSQREDTFETIVNGDMAWPFSGTVQYFENDYLTIANLECSLSYETLYSSSLFNFCGDAGNAEMLVLGGVDFVTLGNNHTMDFGQEGLVLFGGGAVGFGQTMGHFVVVPALGCQLGAAPLVGPGGIEDGHGTGCSNLRA